METRDFRPLGPTAFDSRLRLRRRRRPDGARVARGSGQGYRACAGRGHQLFRYGCAIWQWRFRNESRTHHGRPQTDAALPSAPRSVFRRQISEPSLKPSRDSMDGSLQRLKMDQVDIFHLHNPITLNGGGETLSVAQVRERSRSGVRGAAARRKNPLPRHHRDRRHRRSASDHRCRTVRQRAGQLQHAERLGRHRLAAKLSGAGLRSAVRPHAKSRRRCRRHPRSCRRCTQRHRRTPPHRQRHRLNRSAPPTAMRWTWSAPGA